MTVAPDDAGRTRRPRWSGRARVGAAIVALWVAALAALVARDARRDDSGSMQTAAARVAPGTVDYTIEQGGAQIGYASSRIDTADGGLALADRVVAELPIGGRLNRVEARLRTTLTRALALRAFDLRLESGSGPLAVTGVPVGDTLLVLTIAANGAAVDTQRVRVDGPILLPTVVPLVVGLGGRPRVGGEYRLTSFDPLSLAPRPLTLRVRAESLFVVSDSAVFDARRRRWVSARTDTVRAWRVEPAQSAGFAGWVDEQGRIVRLDQSGGFTLRRTAFELGFSNWRLASRRPEQVRADADILETTAVAASAPLRRGQLARLRVRLPSVDLAGFELASDRQTLRGDTLTVVRDAPGTLAAGYALPGDAAFRARFARELAAEPLLQVGDPAVRALARRLAAGTADPRVAAERINRWVHDSLGKDISIGVPNAVRILATRNGDCSEHTQLYLALARAAGIPARGAAGLARTGGKFYYHAWPEVYLGRWVPVDPTFGEFPADAGHLRFVTGGLGRQAELLRLIGALRIDVLESE